MIRLSVIYPRVEGEQFDWDYYINKHIPLVARCLAPAMKSVSVEQGIAGGTPGAPSDFIAMAHLGFNSMPEYKAAFKPHAAELLADIPNYTKIKPIIQISEVKVSM